MNPYGVFRHLYHALVPDRVRRHGALARWADRLRRFAPHEVLYSEEYYRVDVEGPAAHAAPILAHLIMAEFQPKCVIDVGCGTGALLDALRTSGCEGMGLEYAQAALRRCGARGLRVQKFDLERDIWSGVPGSFDVAISLEVAEHLPERAADRYLDLLTCLAPVVVFTAATVGQGGTDHVNEQPHEYWIERYAARGYRYEGARSEQWRHRLEEQAAASFYARNLMIFRDGQRP